MSESIYMEAHKALFNVALTAPQSQLDSIRRQIDQLLETGAPFHELKTLMGEME